MIGWYYLHTNGSLIYKPHGEGIVADLRESDFVQAFWPIDPANRESGWTILVEGLAAGASPARVAELAERWGCTDRDAPLYAERVGCVLQMDGGGQWHAARRDHFNLQESPNGFGATCLEAMAALAKDLGYEPSKMWASTFKGLLGEVTA